MGKLHIVTKSDVDMGAPYVIGVFTDHGLAVDACRGPGTFAIHSVDPDRAYRRGSMLDVEVIENVTASSVRTTP